MKTTDMRVEGIESGQVELQSSVEGIKSGQVELKSGQVELQRRLEAIERQLADFTQVQQLQQLIDEQDDAISKHSIQTHRMKSQLDKLAIEND